LREARRLRVLKNREPREIVGRRRDEAPGEWIKLNSEELNDLYCLANIVLMTKPRM